MSTSARGDSRYAMSFSTGTLLSRESVIAAPLYLDTQDWAAVRGRLNAENLLQARTASSRDRLAWEVVQRLATLTETELRLLIEASPSERSHLMWAAACRRYAFIGDFAEEVVRERFLLLTPALGYAEFDSFVRGKSLWHPELAELKPSTLQKLRSNLFRMLADAGLFANGEITQAMVSQRVLDVLNARVPSDVRFLPTRASKEVTL